MATSYDEFAVDYDRFVNWQGRLAVELPFIEQQLKPLIQPDGAFPSVLDAACGTGMHAIALGQQGYPVAGADISAGMIERARDNAKKAGLQVRFETAGFGALARSFPGGPGWNQSKTALFNAILCLGNSLPHVLTEKGLAAALLDFAACLHPGGLLLVQNRNFDAVLRRRDRWMEPQAYQESGKEWLFLRFYDFEADGLINFNIITLKRQDKAGWIQQVTSTRLRPLRQEDLVGPLTKAGFTNLKFYGSLAGDAFDPETSGNLVITAIKMYSP